MKLNKKEKIIINIALTELALDVKIFEDAGIKKENLDLKTINELREKIKNDKN